MRAAAVLRKSFSIAGLSALGDLLSPARITAAALRLGIQLFLVVFLWRALYANTNSSAGMTKVQAISYAVLAVLALRIRFTDRWSARDTVFQHVQYGTIVYWYLRPLPVPRYYCLRAVGDQFYGVAWAVLGYVICRALGVLSAPASAAAAGAFVITFTLGQIILYYLVLITDQLCFWTLRNSAAQDILMFALNLLSGAYAALWFFPGWFRAMSAVLPFEATLDIPLSFYIGRLQLGDLPVQLVVQATWVAALCGLTRLLWRTAGRRVVSQGG